MSFYARKGKWGLKWYPKTASTVFAKDSLVAWGGSGYITPSTSSTDAQVGIVQKAVAATDSDYAATTLLPVEVPMEPTAEMEGDVTNGTLAVTSVGAYFDLVNASGVNQAASSNDAVLCTGFISASKGMFQLNSLAAVHDPA